MHARDVGPHACGNLMMEPTRAAQQQGCRREHARSCGRSHGRAAARVLHGAASTLSTINLAPCADSHEIFRGIKATLSRTTLEDDGAGRRKLLVVHRALTRFLWLSVTFDTQLYVWEDDAARTIRFTNARSDGFMRRFEGTWHVQPFTQSTLDAIFRHGGQQGQQAQLASAEEQQQWHGWMSPACALSALSQRELPGVPQRR